MTPLLLVAASGLAREALAAADAADAYETLGFLDDEPALWGSRPGGLPVLGGLEEVKTHDAQVLVCAGKGTARRRIVSRLTELGVGAERYATVVHSSVRIPPSCTVGRGSILLAGVVMTTDVTVGRHVVAMPNVTLTHDDAVEDYATLCAGVTLGGGVVVETEAYLGMSSCVRERLRVGARSTLGMGSVLTREVPEGQTWAGVPARPLTGRQQEA